MGCVDNLRIGFHRALFGHILVLGPFPVRNLMSFRWRHVTREALVEPKIIPPAHRDQVAIPLMCHFMRLNADTVCLSAIVLAGVTSSSWSLKVMAPQFSMAP